MFSQFRKQCEETLAQALKNRGVERKIALVEPEKGFGELSSSLSFELASTFKKAPEAIAEELVKEITLPRDSLIKEVRAASGYINFYLNYEALAAPLIKSVKSQGKDYGRGAARGEKIILEHTSANPDGPLHIGHGRNAILGDALARILSFAGFEVETQYYINDMGRQLAVVVFGLRRLKLDKSKKKDEGIGDVYIAANKILEADKTLEKQISQLMKLYEAGDKQVVEEFKSAAEYCIAGIIETLQRLGIKHDAFIWESNFVRDSSVSKVVEKLKGSKYAEQKEVLQLSLKEFGIKKELVLTRSDGTYLYTTRDIAYHIWKAKQGKAINVWGADHKLASRQLAAALKILGEKEPEFIIYEFISLPEGSMSTRRGIFVSMDELVEETVKRAYEEVHKRRPEESEEAKRVIAEKVGVAAVRYSIARVSPEKAMTFRWEEALDFERQGAPFIQYACARACRILEKSQASDSFKVTSLTENEKSLLKLIARFPELVEEAANSRKPAIIANYAQELADAFHRFYMFEPVLKSEEKDFRLNLVEATRITLANALALLGIEALERM